MTHTAAANLLLDFSDLTDRYVLRDTQDHLRSDDLCLDRRNVGGTTSAPMSEFVATINDKEYRLHVT